MRAQAARGMSSSYRCVVHLLRGAMYSCKLVMHLA
jgi:hypothetical protein